MVQNPRTTGSEHVVQNQRRTLLRSIQSPRVLGRFKDVTRRDLEYKNADSLREMVINDFRKVLQLIKKDVSVPFREKGKILEADEKEI
jgi:hypothetical protein